MKYLPLADIWKRSSIWAESWLSVVGIINVAIERRAWNENAFRWECIQQCNPLSFSFSFSNSRNQRRHPDFDELFPFFQLFKILDYRNDEVVHENIFSLKDFASIASGESKSMLYVTQHARNDSRVMEVASLIAMVYLPASLITVSLSFLFQ